MIILDWINGPRNLLGVCSHGVENLGVAVCKSFVAKSNGNLLERMTCRFNVVEMC